MASRSAPLLLLTLVMGCAAAAVAAAPSGGGMLRPRQLAPQFTAKAVVGQQFVDITIGGKGAMSLVSKRGDADAKWQV
jgi:hypothetical protein